MVVECISDHDITNAAINWCIGRRFLRVTQGIILPIHRDEGKRYVVQQNLFIGMWSMYLCLTFSEFACCQDTYATISWCSGGWFLPLTQGMDSPTHRIEDCGRAMYVMSIMGVSYMFLLLTKYLAPPLATFLHHGCRGYHGGHWLEGHQNIIAIHTVEDCGRLMYVKWIMRVSCAILLLTKCLTTPLATFLHHGWWGCQGGHLLGSPQIIFRMYMIADCMLWMYVKLTMGVPYVFCYSPSVCVLPLATSLCMFDMDVLRLPLQKHGRISSLYRYNSRFCAWNVR